MVTLEELALKGKRKLTAKIPIMKENYEAALELMIENFKKTPFGPKTKKAYETGIRKYALDNYKAKVTEDIVDKWYRNWIKAVSR